MAGMLPGVEAARRRKFHQSIINHNYTGGATATTTAASRRSFICLYANSHNFQINSTSSMVLCDDEKLEAGAREAKKRLDQKLQTHTKSAENKKEIRKKKKNIATVERRLKAQMGFEPLINEVE